MTPEERQEIRMTAAEAADRANRMRALHSLLRRHEPGRTPFRRITPTMVDELLRWAATLPDETLLDMRGIGPTILSWIRDNQPNESQAGRSDFQAGSTLAKASQNIPDPITDGSRLDGRPAEKIDWSDTTFARTLKQTGWRVELFWNSGGGWFTARLVSLWNRDGERTYPGGFLVPFDDPIGTSGATPEEALANLSEAVLEWA